MTYRIVYMGTPEFACPALTALSRMPELVVALTVTQPDRPAGRGRILQSPPVKTCATELGLPVYQTASLRTIAARKPIVDAAPDLIVVAAFGLILGRSVLDLPKHRCINLHASLLPRYRGASPIAAAILNGDLESGVTMMGMESGLDTGPVYATVHTSIDPGETTLSLTRKLAVKSADLISAHVIKLLSNELQPVRQNEAEATLTRPLVKADGWIDWSRPATEIERQVRAMWDWPRAWTTTADGTLFQIHEATALSSGPDQVPGGLSVTADSLAIGCGEGALLVRRGQLAGKTASDGFQLATLPTFTHRTPLRCAPAPESPGPIVRPIGKEG